MGYKGLSVSSSHSTFFEHPDYGGRFYRKDNGVPFHGMFKPHILYDRRGVY